MKENNTMSELEFDIKTIGFAVAFAWIYNLTFFRVIEGLTLDTTNWLFYGVLSIFTGVGAFITSERRNKFSLFVNTVIPFEIITIALYYSELKIIVYICLAIALLISTECIVSLVRKPIRTNNKEKRKRIKKRRLSFCGHYIRNTFAVVFVGVLAGLMAISFIFPSAVAMFDGEKAIVPSGENYLENTIKGNYERLSVLLNEDEWKALSVKEKSAVLQLVCNIEAIFLGLDHELNLKIDNTRQISGAYNEKTHIITICGIDTYSPDDLLDTICHEAYHAMEHAVVKVYDSLPSESQDLYYFANAMFWKKEFENYKSAEMEEDSADLFAYYFQKTEIAARNYAEGKVEYYFTQIQELIDKEGE